MITGEKTAKEGIIPVYQGMWLSAAILLPLGIFLTSKATTDSVIFDIDAYKIYFRKLFGVEKIKNRKQEKLINALSKQTYEDVELIDKLNELKSLTKSYQNDNLRRITFGMTVTDYFKIKEKEKLNSIFALYKEIYTVLLIMAKNHRYYKEKLTEFPSYKLSKLKTGSIKAVMKIGMVVLLPFWLIYLLYYKMQYKILYQEI